MKIIAVDAVCPACATAVPIRIEVLEPDDTLWQIPKENKVVVCTNPNCRAKFIYFEPE